ncbi:PepSY domain-containing protein [uncultured Sneathiella sp.]|uniref:PepSY domain-containing protein n=1 Tax=uncultured Sneathiella sp. TaxID=879315 RepID=UPI0030EE05E9
MKKHMIIAAAIVATGLGAGTIGTALASSGTNDKDIAELQAQQSAKLSIIDAINVATAAQKGTASEVSFDIEKGLSAYEVTVVSSDGSEHEVKIDAMSGDIIKIGAANDKDGEDNDGDEDDD